MPRTIAMLAEKNNILRNLIGEDWEEEILNREEDNETLDKRRAEAEDADIADWAAHEADRELAEQLNDIYE